MIYIIYTGVAFLFSVLFLTDIFYFVLFFYVLWKILVVCTCFLFFDISSACFSLSHKRLKFEAHKNIFFSSNNQKMDASAVTEKAS